METTICLSLIAVFLLSPFYGADVIESVFSNQDGKWTVGRIVAAMLFAIWMLVALLFLASCLIPISGGARTRQRGGVACDASDTPISKSRRVSSPSLGKKSISTKSDFFPGLLRIALWHDINPVSTRGLVGFSQRVLFGYRASERIPALLRQTPAGESAQEKTRHQFPVPRITGQLCVLNFPVFDV
mgnify:CR=1 FL=1